MAGDARSDRADGRSDLVGLALRAALVGVGYYVSARLGLRLALIMQNVTPVWPPTGIAVVGFLLFGRRIWPGVTLAALAVNLPITSSPLAAVVTAAGNTVAPLLAAEFLRAVDFHRAIDRVRDAAAIVVAALLPTLLSATVGAGALFLWNDIPARRFASAWAVWWTGDAMGVLVVAPFLLCLMTFRRHAVTSWARVAEAVLLFAALTAVTFAVTKSPHSLLFLVLPLVGWAAWRFQQRGAAPAALLVALIATFAADMEWGPFRNQSLFSTMLTLQAFNATVALTSFFFAALVSERMRDRDALERSALELEDRVRQRTAELRQSEGQLAEAQQVARIGSWEWLLDQDRVTWSDEMYRIHGYLPQEFRLTFEKAIEQIVPEDAEVIRRNAVAAIAKGADHLLTTVEYRIIRADGEERTLLAKGKIHFNSEGKALRMVGTVQDITEDKLAEREHRIAETLQRSLLPDQLPDIPGIELSARYVPATTDIEVGGDWYDVVPFADGRLGLVIGDVAGHGLRAAAIMGQLRMALRAYAVEDSSPARVLDRLHRLVRSLALPDMATILYLVFDPETGVATFANGGHPPPLLITPAGVASYLDHDSSPPLGAMSQAHHVETTTLLAPGSTLLLFTDGLVERRGHSLRDGLERLRVEAEYADRDIEVLSDHLLTALLEAEVGDDVALLAVRPLSLADRSLHFRVPAEPRSLAPLRHVVRRWLKEIDASPQESHEILVACGEACANAVQHPYGTRNGYLEVDLALMDDDVVVIVRDSGTWRSAPSSGGGHGLVLIRGFMDTVEVDSRNGGTEVRMRRQIGRESSNGSTRPR